MEEADWSERLVLAIITATVCLPMVIGVFDYLFREIGGFDDEE